MLQITSAIVQMYTLAVHNFLQVYIQNYDLNRKLDGSAAFSLCLVNFVLCIAQPVYAPGL